MKPVQKKIVYRSASITNCESNLQELIETALQKTQVNDRQQELNKYEKTFRSINRGWPYRGMLMCEMVLIDPGANQPVAIYNPLEGLYAINTISTQELNQENLRENSDFINSMLYFGVKKNEVVIMPSQAINIRALENHLSWLLGEKLSIIPNDSILSLNKQIPRTIEEKIKSSPVKTIEIGSPIPSLGDSSEKYTSNQSINVSRAMMRKLLDLLKDDVLSPLSDESNIRARVIITYARKTDNAGQIFMDHLAKNLRNLDDEDVTVTLKNNVKITGDALNLQKFIRINRTERGLLATDEISEAMVAWLLALNEKRETS